MLVTKHVLASLPSTAPTPAERVQKLVTLPSCPEWSHNNSTCNFSSH